MISAPLPALNPHLVYSIQYLGDSDRCALCIFAEEESPYYDDDTPLAVVALAEYPEDFEQEIREAILKLAGEYSEYYENVIQDAHYFYTKALNSIDFPNSQDEIR